MSACDLSAAVTFRVLEHDPARRRWQARILTRGPLADRQVWATRAGEGFAGRESTLL